MTSRARPVAGGLGRRLERYLRLWRTLPAEERRMRAGRLVERWLRRDPRVRRLKFLGDQPRASSFRRALAVDPRSLVGALRRPDPSRGPLHADLDPRAARIAEDVPAHAEALLARAGSLLRREFDLFGSGPVRPLRPDGGIDWHRDFKSGRAWPPEVYHLDVRAVRGDGGDVKVPWELSRCQHLAVLGQAYRLAPLCRPPGEAAELRRACAGEVRSQIDDWIAHNPRGLGVNWACTMDVAIRAVNWLSALGLLRDAPELDDAFWFRVLRSLWVHGRHVRRHLEIGENGLTSNHYLANVTGLYALGCALPELREAAAWRALGRRALIEEIERQVLPDGVDFERSIPYHRLTAEMFLHGALYAFANGEPPPASYLRRLERMLEFTASCTRPDGTVPQWGDNDDGRWLPLDGYATHEPHDHRHLLALGGRLLGRRDLVAAAAGRETEARWLLDSATAPPGHAPFTPRSRGFAAAGYYVLRDGDLFLAVPCGPVGTRGVGNHTHNDLLSVDAWAGGREWIADPGTGSYSGDPPLRNRLRSTAAHATLQLGRGEQNPFGTGLEELFVLREGARPEVEQWHADSHGARLVARHAGFADGGGPWIHRREVRFEPNRRCWVLLDTLERPAAARPPAPRGEPVFLRFPLAPALSAHEPPAAAWPRALHAALDRHGSPGDSRRRTAVELSDGDGRRFWIALELPAEAGVEIGGGLYSPRYGVTVGCRVLVATVPPPAEVRAVTVLLSPEPDGAA